MPTPMGHNVPTDSLESRSVGVEAELPVTQRYLAGNVIPLDIVALDKSTAVDWRINIHLC